jgi:hypothetical protein
VLVYGNSISGLEVAGDLAADDTIAVTSACRHPRYVLQKMVRGLPTDWRWFNRFSALLAAALRPEELAAAMRVKTFSRRRGIPLGTVAWQSRRAPRPRLCSPPRSPSSGRRRPSRRSRSRR